MSMLLVHNAVCRARMKVANHKSLIVPPTMKILCSTIEFIAEHIHLLEEQLGEAQNAKHKAIDEHHRMLKINAQLCNILEDKGMSKEEIQKIVDYV